MIIRSGAAAELGLHSTEYGRETPTSMPNTLAMSISGIQEVVQALAPRQPVNPEVASIKGRDTSDPVLLGHPEQGSIRQIHRQVADLAHPGRHRFQGRSIGLRKVQPTERHPGQEPRCQIRRNQLADLDQHRPGRHKSPLMPLKEPSAGFMVLITAIKPGDQWSGVQQGGTAKQAE